MISNELSFRMPLKGAWFKLWIYLGFVCGCTKGARPRFDTSTDMGLVLVPADAEIESVIFRLRATDQDADFPLIFDVAATVTPVVRIDNLPCTLYNKVCQANVVLTRRLIPGRLHDFAVRVRDSKGDSNSMQATISVTNATTPRDTIFPHIPSLIMVPENTRPGTELDYLLVRANQWSGKPVYIELWQPKELFTIRQRQTPSQTRGIITLIGELDFETQSMYTLTMYATDPYTEPGKDTRNIAGLNVVVVVQDVQDVPPIFTLAPPLTKINNSVQPGDVVLRVHAEDGDKGVPREITYGLVSEGNPFTLFFNISETTGEIILARPLEELTKITHVGAPVVLSVVAEEIRRVRDEPPAQATVVEVGLLLGEPGNSPPYFESDNYVATIDENPEPGTVIKFPDAYSTKVRDEDIGKAGVFALKLDNNNGTFEITPTVAERTADFIVTVRDNALIDYEIQKSLTFMIRAQEVGPATNLSTSVPVTIFLRDVNDNPPIFDEDSYEATLSENVTAGTRVVQVHATDRDTGLFGSIRYTGILGEGGEAFAIDPDTGLITVAMGSSLDREMTAQLQLSVEARDENGKGNRGVVPLIINLLDVNDNAPVFEKDSYEFMLNSDLTNFTRPAFIKASDADAEAPNNIVRYELIHGNYENKFDLNEITGELILRSPITKIRRKKQSVHEGGNEAKLTKPFRSSKGVVTGAEGGVPPNQSSLVNSAAASGTPLPPLEAGVNKTLLPDERNSSTTARSKEKREAEDDALYILTARAYDLGVPHLHSEAQIRIIRLAAMESRIVMFVVPGEHPDIAKTTRTLTTITGGTVTVMEIRPYVPQNHSGNAPPPPPPSIPMEGGKKSIVIARVDQKGPSSVVDIEKIREALAANGVGILNGMDGMMNMGHSTGGEPHYVNNTIINNREVTLYKAENKLLFWLLIILGLLILLALAILIICCICPGCPFYMEPRKRRVHSSETLVVRADGRPRRHLHRKHPPPLVNNNWPEKKEAWSADPTRRNWQFNRRNTKQLGLASLPGDVAYISGPPNEMQLRAESLRLRDGLPEGYDAARARGEEIYVEDVDGQKVRGYDTLDVDSLRRHELDRGSDDHRQSFRYVDHARREDADAREQHFYREGNAEVLRLVTRGEIGQNGVRHPAAALVVDGKDILLRRFIEDQKIRHDGSVHDVEAARSMESQPRVLKDVAKQEIILVPEKLELEHRQHVEELGPTVQRLVIDHSSYGGSRHEKEALDQQRESHLPEPLSGLASGAVRARERTQMVDEQLQSTVNTRYSYHDMELARQNALLTRLLLEREGRVVGAPVLDAASYLETQSLPGQVAIATQTDKTTATQTERQNRSRSDNDESEDDSRSRRKFRSKKRHGEYDSKRTRAFWMKSPIEEEENPSFDQKLNILRRKFEEVKDAKKMSLEPDVLREISDSLDGNGSSYSRGDASCREDEVRTRMYRRSKEEASTRYKRLQDATSDGWQSSVGRIPEKFDRAYRGPDRKLDTNGSTSSPEVYRKPEKKSTVAAGEKSPRKLPKKSPKKSTEPSFRILEKEITLLARKLSKFGDKKKAKDSTGSDSQEKNVLSRKESRRETLERSQKKRDAPHARDARQEESLKVPEHAVVHEKDAVAVAAAKGRPKLKQQHTPVISTGSSEYEEAFERRKKQSSPGGTGGKQKPVAAPAKPKRMVVHGDKPGEARKALDQAGEKKKSKDTRVESVKVEKPAKAYTRPQKLGVVGRREHVQEDAEAKASKPEVKGGSSRGSFPGKDAGSRDAKDVADVAERSSTRASRKFSRKVQECAAGRTLDDVEELSREDPRKQRVAGKEEESAGEGEKASRIDIEKVATKITSNIMEAAVDEVKEEESAISLKEMLMNFAELEHGGDEGAAPSGRVTDEKRLPSPPLGSDSASEETRKLDDNSQASDFSAKETTTAMIRHGELEENEVLARPPSGTGGEPRREATTEPAERKVEPEEPAGSRDKRVTEVEKSESTKPEVASSLEDPVLATNTEDLGSRISGDPVTSGRALLSDSDERVRSAAERSPRVGVRVSRSNEERGADRKESGAMDGDTDRGIPSVASKFKDPESPGLSTPSIGTRVEGVDAGVVASETREIQMLTTDAIKASAAGSGDDLEKPAESLDLAERPGELPATSPVSTGDIKKKADAEEAIKSEKSREIVKRRSESAECLEPDASSPPPLETVPRKAEKIGSVTETTSRHLGDEAEESVELHKGDAISEGEARDGGKLDKVQPLGFEDNFVDEGRIGAGEEIPYIDEDLSPCVDRLQEGSNYDSDSSSGGSSDVSGKTTLKVAPYQTPRHSPRATAERKRDEVEYQELKSEGSDEAQGREVLQVELAERDRSREAATSDGTPVVNIDPARDPEGTESPQVPGFKVDSNFHDEASEAKSSDRAEPASKDTEVTEDPVASVEISTNELKPPQTGDEVAAGMRAKQRDGPTEGERGKALGEVDVLEGNGSARDVDEDERSRRGEDGEATGVESVKAGKQITEKARRPQSEKTPVEKKSPRKEKRSSLQEAGGEERSVAAGAMHQSRQATRRSKDEDRERKKSLEQTRQGKRKDEEQQKQHQHHHQQQQTAPKGKPERDKKTWASSSVSPPKIGGDIDTSKTQSKYMAWYKQKREEMEKKRLEMRKNEEEEQLPRWLRRSLSYKKAIQNEQKKNSKTPEVTPRTRRKIKPLVNVESEQLKAIVRQGRKLRKAEGVAEDPSIEIFASPPPPPAEVRDHHLIQHSEYKYEKAPPPPPFYLHPPPPPHPSPQLSPEPCESQSLECRRPDDDLDSGIAVSLQGAARLRHQQLLEKKSVFDIAYSEAAPSQLRADSTTPPS